METTTAEYSVKYAPSYCGWLSRKNMDQGIATGAIKASYVECYMRFIQVSSLPNLAPVTV